MNNYAAIYQKHYIWPDLRTDEPQLLPSPIESTTTAATTSCCSCNDSVEVLETLLDMTRGDCLDWNRTDPMGRLLDAKVYPPEFQKTLEIPRDCTTKLKQPRICEKQPSYRQKYDVKSRIFPVTTAVVEAERMKTTYQVDYSDPAAKRMLQYRKPSTTVIDKADQECYMPLKIILKDCQPYQPRSIRYDAEFNGSKARDYTLRNASKPKNLIMKQIPSWRTEYRDTINKIGQAIMKTKLHQKKIIPVWTH